MNAFVPFYVRLKYTMLKHFAVGTDAKMWEWKL